MEKLGNPFIRCFIRSSKQITIREEIKLVNRKNEMVGCLKMDDKPIVINIPTVDEWPMKDLKRVCRHKKIKGYTKMSREELVLHVREVIRNMKPIEE
jgi:hypothetical protein